MHKLIINTEGKDTEIKLDDFKLQNVSEYTIASSSGGATELTIKLLVNNTKIEI